MTMLTIEIPEEVEKTLSDLVVLLGGRVIATNSNTKQDRKSHPIEKQFSMSDQDLKRLSDLAKNKRKAGVTREQALKSFISIGIMNEKG